MRTSALSTTTQGISLLLITASKILTELLKDTFETKSFLAHWGVARDVPETLYLLQRICPDVILLDPTMTFKEDMTLLQHIMKRQPTPTILLPSIGGKEFKPPFSALQNGAVDLVWQEAIIENLKANFSKKQLSEKLVSGAKLNVTSLQSSYGASDISDTKDNLIFCEECGATNNIETSHGEKKHYCTRCGTLIRQEAKIENLKASTFKKKLVEKVVSASKLDVTSLQSIHGSEDVPEKPAEKKVDIVFCEECGARNTFETNQPEKKHLCSHCGDIVDIHLVTKYKRTHYVTIIAAGTGSYANLLRIIPKVPAKIRGAVIIVLYGEDKYVNTFTEYLDSISKINVQRIKSGTSIEGGNCYLTTASKNFYMKPYSTRHSMAVTSKKEGWGPADLLMKSVSAVFKNNTAGLILSGTEFDGTYGFNSIKHHEGTTAVLYAANSLYRQMGEHVLRKCKVDKIVNEHDATEFIYGLHNATPPNNP